MSDRVLMKVWWAGGRRERCYLSELLDLAHGTGRRWLLKAEGLAGVPKQRGSLWHAFRRGWATARKHFPPKDTVAAGRWSSTKTLLRCYQQADEATMLAVVLGGAELRDRRAQ